MNQEPLPQDAKTELPTQINRYHCECIGCVGEWTGSYATIEELQSDIVLYCKTGQAKYTVIDESHNDK